MPAVKKILHIDDDELFCAMVRNVLAPSGKFKLETAPHGIAGLNKMQSFRPDIVLLDYQMPYVNGMGVLRLMGHDKTLAVTPVIFLSGIEQISEEHKVPRNVAAYLTKPFKPQELLDLLDEVGRKAAAGVYAMAMTSQARKSR